MKILTLTQPAPRTDAEYAAAAEEMLVEMRHMNEQMEVRQSEIDRLQARSDVLRAETRAILLSMGAKL